MHVIKPLNCSIGLVPILAIVVTRNKEQLAVKNIPNGFMGLHSLFKHLLLIMSQLVMMAIGCIATDEAVVELRFSVVVKVGPVSQLSQPAFIQVDISDKSYFQSFHFIQHWLPLDYNFLLFRVTLINSLKWNRQQLFSKMQDDQFDILVSTTDFLKMQSRCHDLEQEMRKLVAQKDEIDLKLLEMGTRNADQTRKIIRLQESNKYLSLQGIKIAKAVLESSRNHPSIQQATSQAQTEIDYEQNCASCSQLQKSAQSIAAEWQKQKQRSKQQEKQYHDQYQAIKVKLQAALQKNIQMAQALADSQQKVTYLQKQSEVTLFYIEQLKSTNNNLSQKIDNLQLGLKCLEKEKEKIGEELDIYRHDRQNLLREVSILNQSIKQSDETKQMAKNKWKLPEQVKACREEEARSQVNNQYTLALQELNKKMVKLEETVREKDSLIVFYGEQEKKQNNQINQLSSELNRLKPKKTNKVDPQEEVRVKLDQYFTNFAFQLFDSGGIKSEDIEKTLKSQEEALKRFIQDTVSSIASNLVKSKRNFFFNCMRTP